MSRDNLTTLRGHGTISARRAMNLRSDVVKSPLKRAFSDDDPKYHSVRVAPASANPELAVKPPVAKQDLDEDDRERQALDRAKVSRFSHARRSRSSS